MGLTANSTGAGAVDKGLLIEKNSKTDKVIALAGNPNVGKSTVFNELTGMKQHTGNWPGKTVSNAQGRHTYQGIEYILVDLPGTYSLAAHSAEEEVARDFICFGESDAAIVVCDATCLERNLNLVLQTIEITPNVIVCVNLMDEAKKKHIEIDLQHLEGLLGIPVCGASARSRKGLTELMESVRQITQKDSVNAVPIRYSEPIEKAIDRLIPVLDPFCEGKIKSRWVALRLLEDDKTILEPLKENLGVSLLENPEVKLALEEGYEILESEGITLPMLLDRITQNLIQKAERLAKACVSCDKVSKRDRQLDKILTSKWAGVPIMLLLLGGIFWLTIVGANYPSELLSTGLFWVQDRLLDFFHFLGTPQWVEGILVLGVYRVLAWVVSVMLPPMAIFFPLFTLLEDFGYLPRVAFNLDHHFKKAGTCGKQSLTMCMGFGCNAAGIVGCRIIDSPRERLIAILTNNFVPCNGRFPTLIAIITMFFAGVIANPLLQSAVATLLLLGVIILGVAMTFWISRLLSKTILKGMPSSFALELPPYRRPQIGKVIVRSVFDRTLFVLGRAVAVAAPAGAVIWLLANIKIGDVSVLAACANFLDPVARWFGLDGVILIAFILGFPANEIVVPIIIMAYMATGTIVEYDSLFMLKELLISHGWTWITAICTMLFCLFHWPCSTTCITIKKESGSMKWTLASFFIPTAVGLTVCFIVANLSRLIMMIFA